MEYDTAAQIVEVTAEEREAKQREIARSRSREEGGCKTLEDFVALGVARGYADGWAQHRWTARQARAHG